MTAAPARLPYRDGRVPRSCQTGLKDPGGLCCVLPSHTKHAPCPQPPAPSPRPASQLVAGGREAQNNPAREGQPVAPQSPASRS